MLIHHKPRVMLTIVCVTCLGSWNPVSGVEPDDSNLPKIGPALQRYTPEQIEAAYAGRELPEAIRMYLTIVRGGRMSGDAGWFGPAQTSYDWRWLAAQHGISEDKAISARDFAGSPSQFQLLDRDHSGQISRDDLDWSSSHPWVVQSYQINRFVRRMDQTGDGRLNRAEWLAVFDRIGDGQTDMPFEVLRDALFSGGTGKTAPADAPSQETLVQGLFAGEIGSVHEGPAVGEPAPRFSLNTIQGDRTVALADLLGDKPTVLVFGNFTCGPFRSMFPAVNQVAKDLQDQAHFVFIYVREAHPRDGWSMDSNARAGIDVPQPRSYEQRCEVAAQCEEMLDPAMPLLVDHIDDTVGNAYSGMPARLYVIDPSGVVAFKGGRGPFGFKVDEMAQALTLCLLAHADGHGTTRSE